MADGKTRDTFNEDELASQLASIYSKPDQKDENISR